MKVSENWLRQWVNPPISRVELCDLLTMSGLEVESSIPVATNFSGVVVAQVVTVEKHPEADNLTLCTVDAGQADKLLIVCGAKNVRAGMKVPLAQIGAVLPDGTNIKQAKLRGVISHGMLCSATELALSDSSEGLLELNKDAPLGMAVWEYFALNDYVIDISITPNRGDCLSVLGLATEIAALTSSALEGVNHKSIKPTLVEQLPIHIEASADCARYAGRIIKNINTDVPTPIWIKECLRRSGIRSINAVVDVVNYVMLELGQPMHAFDLTKISGGIEVRKAKKGETLTLLDGTTTQLSSETLVIADKMLPLAIAGVMGGLASSVSLSTQDIFLESAYFTPETIMTSVRQYGLSSDSSYRFERGVAPEVTIRAIERATELLLSIVGGESGPVHCVENANVPKAKKIILPEQVIKQILGVSIPQNDVTSILKRLGFQVEVRMDAFEVTVPARRFDITASIDLIEEVARVYGYNQISLKKMPYILSQNESELRINDLRQFLCFRGYHEVVTYSFVAEKLQRLFTDENAYLKLVNPITQDMEVMRTNLWTGLLNTLIYNQNRQQDRIRIFETGIRFRLKEGELTQQKVLSGLINGETYPTQWGVKSGFVDFFDLKGDLEALFELTHDPKAFGFRAGHAVGLHPGQTAEILYQGNPIGLIGSLHPELQKKLDIHSKVFLFELLVEPLLTSKLPHYREISKFPLIRRDISILVDRTVPIEVIQDTIVAVAATDWLQGVQVFDVYEGQGVPTSLKSVALSLTLQHMSRTLVDEEVTDLMEKVISALKDKFAAELRG